MDLKIVIALARRYLASTVIVVLMLAGGMVFVWGEYKELSKQKDQLATERKALYEERALSEKNRADTAIALMERKVEIDKREFALQQLEAQNKERLTILQQKTAENDVALEKVKQGQSVLSQAQRQKEAEEKIQTLMSEFSAMGVNLNDPLHCGDSEALTKHNAAKSKYTEIYTLAEANRLTQRFRNFLFHNGQMLHSACTK